MSLARMVRDALLRCGYDLRRRGAFEPDPVYIPDQQQTMAAALERAAANGIAPATVIDVGVAHGTEALYNAFPDAHLVLVEALHEFRSDMERIAANRGRATCVAAAAGSAAGELAINVHPDLEGSSLYLERERGTGVNGVPRTVPVVTLDAVAAKHSLSGPYVLKVDVQGAELDVLSGANAVLCNTAYVVLETSLFSFFEGGPQIADCMAFMAERGFVPYDFFGAHFRPLDGAMSQIDVAFVPADGVLRRMHVYATSEQRAEQNRRMLGTAGGEGGRA